MNTNSSGPDRHLRDGLWSQMEASLRSLESHERPAWCLVPDDRMVVFGEQTSSGMCAPRETGIYSPMETPALAADLMRVFAGRQSPRDERVVEFYRRYGPLSQKAMIDGNEAAAWAERLSPAARRQLSAEARLSLCEPLWWVAEQARKLRLFYDAYRALAGDDLVSLRTMLGEVPQGEEVRGVRLAATGSSLLTAEVEAKTSGRRRAGSAAVERPAESLAADVPRRPLTDQECRRWGYQLLADQLTQAQAQSWVSWMVDDDGGYRLVQGRRFPDLMVAVYLQLGEMMEQRKLYRLCEGCGGPFWSEGGKRRFCHPRCGDAYRQRCFYRHAQTETTRGRRRKAAPGR